MPLDLTQHPCFNADNRHRSGRIHLPVAPKCNVQCNFCNRRFDCANESRPGVTSAVLSPTQALHYLSQVIEQTPDIAVVGIAGPGDPLANPTETLETLRLVRERFPEMLLCVATNGLALAPYVPELAELQVSHVTITINALDPEIGGQIYAWVREGNRVHRGRDGAARLLECQLQALETLKQHGITVKVNTLILPGVNDEHIAELSRQVAEMGADILNCVPLYPVAGTPFESIEEPSPADVQRIRAEAARYLPQMHHCTRCRADAVGRLGESMSAEIRELLERAASMPLRPADDRPYVAVATREGVLVNQHLGEADSLSVYGEQGNGFELIERRITAPPGGGKHRWRQLAELLHDCRAVLVSSAGPAPCAVLGEAGIRVVFMEGLIDEGLQAVYGGHPIRAPLRREHQCGAGASCAGDGTGCM
jgi:nitrogen fixation protein NifB